MTTKQRIELAVQKKAFTDSWAMPVMFEHDAVALILAERARLKRQVRKLDRTKISSANQDYGYHLAIRNVLKLWEG